MCGFPIWQIIAYTGYHFLLSGWVAWLVYSWMATTYSRILPDTILPTTASFMRRGFLLVSLSFALVAHIVEDYWIGWF